MRLLRTLSAVLVLALGASATTAMAQGAAAGFPSRPIKIIVPFSPGGATDVLARMFGQELSKAWGQPVVVENKPGAGGNIGAEAGAKAAPDGHTLLLVAAGFMAVSPSLYPKLPFDPVKDYAPVTLLVTAPLLLAVHPSVPAKTVKEFIELARSQPGKISIGNGGTGTAQHLGGEYFTSTAGITVIHVPYKGSAPATTDLLSGQVNAMLDNMVTLIPHVKSGRLRALGVSALQRAPNLPEVPTIAESALPGFETGTWYGIVAPAGTPPEIVAKLNAEMVRGVRAPEIAAKLIDMGLAPAGNTPEQFSAMIKAEIAKYATIVKQAGIKPD
jgi:tripartite-type tricarboxylate transporter receptor subunit TctC